MTSPTEKPAVSASPYTSLQALAPTLNLLPPETVRALAAEVGSVWVASRRP